MNVAYTLQVATPLGKTAGRRSGSAERIVTVARELFGRDGYGRTTIKQIADRCSLSDAAVLYHFPSKRHILEAVLEPPELAPVPLPDSWDPLEFARTIVDCFYAWEPHWARVRVLLVQALDDDLTSSAFSIALNRSWSDVVSPALKPHCGAETEEIAAALATLFNGILTDRLISSGADFEATMGDPKMRELLVQCVLLVLPPAPDVAPVSATG